MGLKIILTTFRNSETPISSLNKFQFTWTSTTSLASTSTQDFHSPLFCNFHIALSDITKNHSKKQSLSGNVCGHMCTHHHMSKEIYAIKQDFVFKGKGLTLNILFFFILAIISLFYPSYFSIFSIDSFFPSHRLYRVKY